MRAPEATIGVRYVLGPVEVRRMAAEEVHVGGWAEPDYEYRPNAAGAFRRLTLLFGSGPVSSAPRRTKTLWAKSVLEADDPTEAQWQEAERLARQKLAAVVSRHGLQP